MIEANLSEFELPIVNSIPSLILRTFVHLIYSLPVGIETQ